LASHGWLARQQRTLRIERLARRLDVPWVRHVRRRLIKDVSQHLTIFSPGGTYDWSHTAAFCPWSAQQGIRINVQGRDPQGMVAQDDYQALRGDIRQALLETTEPETGMRAIDAVWGREELYAGPHAAAMPDLVFTLRPGFASSPVVPALWAPTGWASGDHSLHGLFAAWGEHVLPGRLEGARLVDVAPTALYFLGTSLPAGIDGDVLRAAIDPAYLAANPIRRQAVGTQGTGTEAVEQVLSKEQEAELRHRLEGLGYL
ncbi:MAG: hypothetical protein AB8I80_20620, partial [Anaerolineae bacterium]